MSNDHKKNYLMGKRGLIVATSFILAIIIATTLFNTQVIAFLSSQKLIPTPDRYTELYFNHNVNLPTTLTADPISFSFSIHNVEGSRTVYPYTIVAKPVTGTARTLSTSSVTLASNAVATISKKLTLPQTNTDVEILVLLPNQQQEIHLWLRAK